MIDTILLAIAAVAFAMAALKLVEDRFNLIAVGLFCWVLSVLI